MPKNLTLEREEITTLKKKESVVFKLHSLCNDETTYLLSIFNLAIS